MIYKYSQYKYKYVIGIKHNTILSANTYVDFPFIGFNSKSC